MNWRADSNMHSVLNVCVCSHTGSCVIECIEKWSQLQTRVPQSFLNTHQIHLSLWFYTAPDCIHEGIVMRRYIASLYSLSGAGGGPPPSFRRSLIFLVMPHKRWTVCSGRWKHPSGRRISGSFSDEGKGNLRRARRSRNSHKGVFRCDWRVASLPASPHWFTSSCHHGIFALFSWSWCFFKDWR